jgi:hypothetical protein
LKSPPSQKDTQTHTQLAPQKMGHPVIQRKEVRWIIKFLKRWAWNSFSTQNTKQNILKSHAHTNKCNRSGIYQMKCLGCPLKWMRQTGRTLNIRLHKTNTFTPSETTAAISDTQSSY